MRICEQRKARRRKQSPLSASHGPLRLRHQSLVCHSRFALAPCEERSAWWGGKRDVASIKSISFDDVTTKQELILRKACSRRSDSRARAENLTRTPLSERLQQATLRSARTDQKQPPKFGTHILKIYTRMNWKRIGHSFFAQLISTTREKNVFVG